MSLLVLLEHGVPKDSILGPLLFFIYNADISRIVNNRRLLWECYANETNLCGACLFTEWEYLYNHRYATNNLAILCSSWPWSRITCRHIHQMVLSVAATTIFDNYACHVHHWYQLHCRMLHMQLCYHTSIILMHCTWKFPLVNYNDNSLWSTPQRI